MEDQIQWILDKCKPSGSRISVEFVVRTGDSFYGEVLVTNESLKKMIDKIKSTYNTKSTYDVYRSLAHCIIDRVKSKCLIDNCFSLFSGSYWSPDDVTSYAEVPCNEVVYCKLSGIDGMCI